MKIGDKVVCINNTDVEHALSLNKVYIISDIMVNNYILIQYNFNKDLYFIIERFKLLKDIRKNKLKQIIC